VARDLPGPGDADRVGHVVGPVKPAGHAIGSLKACLDALGVAIVEHRVHGGRQVSAVPGGNDQEPVTAPQHRAAQRPVLRAEHVQRTLGVLEGDQRFGIGAQFDSHRHGIAETDIPLAGVSAETSARTEEERARVLLADLIDWHRREAKPAWWRYFYLCGLSSVELIGAPHALSGSPAGHPPDDPGQRPVPSVGGLGTGPTGLNRDPPEYHFAIRMHYDELVFKSVRDSEPLPRPAAELEQLAGYYDTHDTSAEMEVGDWVEPQPMATTSLRLPVDVIEELKRQARARHLRYTSYVRSILEQAARGETPSPIADITARLERIERAVTERQNPGDQKTALRSRHQCGTTNGS
jgi:hypothetical protein